jgi:phosphatidylserine synthase
MDFVSTSITTHVYAIVILMLIMGFNLISVLKVKDFMKLTTRLRFMTPLYHMLNFIAAYTGAIVAAYSHDLSWTVILMIITTILIMVLEIKRYKKMRVIRSKDYDKQNEFIPYAKKIYMIEISAVVFTYVISKIF